MESSKVFVLCAVIATSFVVVHAVPIPGLLSQFFGGEDLSQPKQNADVNQLLRQYYLSPTSDPYAQAQYNPYAQQLNYPQPQPNYYPSAYPDQSYGLLQQQNQGYYPSPYGQLPSYRGLDSSYGGNLASAGNLGSAGSLGSAAGLRSVASASAGGGPAARSAPADDSLAASHFSKQLDSLLPSSGKSLQSFASFRMLPSGEAEDSQQVNVAEALPAQSALQQQAPAARALPERAPTLAARASSAEELESSKQ